jgi:quercetin dioxygenase-like cupin family protein
MSELVVPMRELVNALQVESAKHPQLELHTDHYFADGMYARVIARPKDAVIVGKIHKREHFYIVVKGKVCVTTDDGVKEIEAPAVIVSKPGTKRAVWALEDSVCMTVHRTDNTDLDVIEAELIEPDDLALFDSSNHLKELT